MAAPKKITPEMEAAILRRRAAGDRIKAIAADFGIAHQTVSKLAKHAAETHVGEAAHEANAQQPPQAFRSPTPASEGRVLRHPMLPSVFASWEERLAYYANRQLESESDKLNYRDALSGRETPAECRARETGTLLSLR